MAETFFSWKDFYKGTKIHDALYSSFVNCSNFRIFCNTLNGFLCSFCLFSVLRVDCYSSVVISVDCYIILCTESLNVLSARSDKGANLVYRNLHCKNLRSVLCKWSRLVDAFFHNRKNVETTLTSLFHSLLHNFCCYTGNLDIHLETSNTVFCSGNLKVHITKVIFFTKNIAQNLVTSVWIVSLWFCDKTHGNTGNHLLHRDTGSKHRKTSTTSRSL